MRFADGSSSVQYEYDSLGNRIAKVEGGMRTEYLIDPLGLTNVVAEFDNGGNLIARYVHGGFGLVSRHDSGGAAAFYDFDGVGSTVAMTDVGANVVNSYSYLPFGEALTISETIGNAFEYVGQFGVQRDGSRLDFMQVRYYSSDIGRFIHEDPIGISGGLNLYRYVTNDPVNYIDPSGMSPTVVAVAVRVIGGVAKGGVIKAPAAIAGRVARKALELGHRLTPSGKEALAKLEAAELAEARAALAEAELIDAEAAAFDNAITVETATLSTGGTVLSVNPAALFIALDPDSPLGFDLGQLVPGFAPTLFLCELAVGGDCVNFLFGFPPPPDEDIDDDSTRQVASADPNDIVGPAGFGPEQFLPADAPLFYTIRFENLAAATAAAQTVVVTQTLDTDLDLSTLELVSFGLGGSVVELPGGRDFFSARFDQSASHGVFLDVSADLNRVTGLLTWRFTSVDPATFDQPQDPFAGFLPPNQTSPQGEGFVSYFVRPKAGLSTGTRLDAQARIVFDTNAPIDTPAIFNTIDAGAPLSAVNALPAVLGTPSFVVSWAGQDDAGGSGIATFDIYVATDGGDFVRWLDDTTNAQATFTGENGLTYAFYSVATDVVRHVELSPAIADTTTTIEGSVPVAVPDDFLATENETLAVPASEGVLKNDTGGAVHAVLVKTTDHGTLELREDGSFVYTPKPEFNREDKFTYRATGGGFDSEEATVNITVDTDFPWHNGLWPVDVDGNNDVEPFDALLIINLLNSGGILDLPTPRPRPLAAPFYDTDPDNGVTPLDALLVINYLNSGEGEGELSRKSESVKPLIAMPELLATDASPAIQRGNREVGSAKSATALAPQAGQRLSPYSGMDSRTADVTTFDWDEFPDSSEKLDDLELTLAAIAGDLSDRWHDHEEWLEVNA